MTNTIKLDTFHILKYLAMINSMLPVPFFIKYTARKIRDIMNKEKNDSFSTITI